MPIGVLADSLGILLGGLIGAAFGKKLPRHIQLALPSVFGCGSVLMGIPNIVKLETMPAVVLSLIVGTLIGEAVLLERRFEQAGAFMGPRIAKLFHAESSDNQEMLVDFVSALVLFCASGTGIFGSLQSGLDGDHTILITKAILDFFTAAIFAITVGYMTAFICIPQTIIMLALFCSAKLLMPVIPDTMLNDFMACGGILIFATGLRIAKIHQFPIGSMIPAMILVMSVSAAWNTWIAPLLG